MTKKKQKKVSPKFKIIKQWHTSKKIYEVGDLFECDNIKVIDFLTQNKYI